MRKALDSGRGSFCCCAVDADDSWSPGIFVVLKYRGQMATRAGWPTDCAEVHFFGGGRYATAGPMLPLQVVNQRNAALRRWVVSQYEARRRRSRRRRPPPRYAESSQDELPAWMREEAVEEPPRSRAHPLDERFQGKRQRLNLLRLWLQPRCSRTQGQCQEAAPQWTTCRLRAYRTSRA